MKKNNYLLTLLIGVTFSLVATATEPTSTSTSQQSPLFEQAATLEQSFITALAQCQKNNNCQSCPFFEAATANAIRHLIAINKHLAKLEQGTDGVCNISERDTVNDLQDRFILLLQSKEAQEVIVELIKKTMASNLSNRK